MLLKTTMYLDLHIFHMRDHKDRGGLETGNLRKQFKNYENFAVIFQKRKQQETRKTSFTRHIFCVLVPLHPGGGDGPFAAACC